MGMGHKVTFRCGDSLISELDKYAAAKGVDRGAAIRRLLESALLAESEGAYAGLIASSVRSELAAWLARSGMDAAAMREMRDAVGAALWLQAYDAAECGGGTMDEWLARAFDGSADAARGLVKG